MSAIFRLATRALVQRNAAINTTFLRTVKTTQKKDETAISHPSAPAPPVTKEDFANPNPANWISYGFDYRSQQEDRNVTNSSFFFSVTLCLVGAAFYYIYMPDYTMLDWAQREAFLELRRREGEGLDLISPDYISPELILLPADDDLKDVEVII